MHPKKSFGKAAYRWPTYQAWRQDRKRQARERGARWRAKQKKKKSPRPITLKARAIRFLTEIIIQPNQSLPVAEVMRRAVSMRLQHKKAERASEALRDARIALGIKSKKMGLNVGWCWLPPTSENPDFIEGGQSAYARIKNPAQLLDPAEGGQSRTQTVEAAPVVSNHNRPTARMDREVAFDQGRVLNRTTLPKNEH